MADKLFYIQRSAKEGLWKKKTKKRKKKLEYSMQVLMRKPVLGVLVAVAHSLLLDNILQEERGGRQSPLFSF